MIPSPRSHFTSPLKHSLLETHGDELAPSKLGPACSELRNEAQGVVGAYETTHSLHWPTVPVAIFWTGC